MGHHRPPQNPSVGSRFECNHSSDKSNRWCTLRLGSPRTNQGGNTLEGLTAEYEDYFSEILGDRDGRLTASVPNPDLEIGDARVEIAFPFDSPIQSTRIDLQPLIGEVGLTPTNDDDLTVTSYDNQISLTNSQALDRLADAAGLILNRLRRAGLLKPNRHRVQIVIESLSHHKSLPYWHIGSNIGSTCLRDQSSDRHQNLFTDFQVWSPPRNSWLRSADIEALPTPQALYSQWEASVSPDERLNLLRPLRELDAIGLIVEAEDLLLSAKMLASTEGPDDLRRATIMAKQTLTSLSANKLKECLELISFLEGFE